MEEPELVFIFIKEEHPSITSRRIFIIETALDQLGMDGRAPHEGETPISLLTSKQYKPKFIMINVENSDFDEIIKVCIQQYPITPIILIYNPYKMDKLLAFEEKYQLKFELNRANINTFTLVNLFCKIQSEQAFLAKNQNENQRYVFIQSLGKGTTSNVDLYFDTIKDRKVAIKKFKGEGMTEEMKKQVLKEVDNMKLIKIPTVIEFYDFEIENDNKFIYMEYANQGTLEEKIFFNKRNGKQFQVDEIFEYLIEIMLGLFVLNKKGMMHRDIKSENILLASEKINGEDYVIAKLSDLGLSRKIDGVIGSMTSCGTPYYVSPEIASGEKRYTYNADIWSLGVVLYELITLNKPWYNPNLQTHQLYNLIFTKKYPKLSNETDGRLKYLVSIMLKKDPNKRATLDEILHLDFMYAKTLEVLKKYGWENIKEFEDIKEYEKDLRPCFLFMKVLEDDDFNCLIDSGLLCCYSMNCEYKQSYFGKALTRARKGDELIKTFYQIKKWEDDTPQFRTPNKEKLFEALLTKKMLIPLSHTLNDPKEFVEEFFKDPGSYYFKFTLEDFDSNTTGIDNKYLCVAKPVPEDYGFLELSQFVLKHAKKLYKEIKTKKIEPIEIVLEPRYILFLAGISLFQECDLFSLPYTPENKSRLAFLLNLHQIIMIHSCINKLLLNTKTKSGLLGYFQYDVEINYKFKNFTLNNLELTHIVFRGNKPIPGNYMRMVYSTDQKCQLLPNYDNPQVLFLLLYDPSRDTSTINPEYFFGIFNAKNVDDILDEITLKMLPYRVEPTLKKLSIYAPFEHYISDFKDIFSFLKFIVKHLNLHIEFTKNKPYKTTLSEEQMSNLQKLNEKYLEKVEKSTIPIDYCFFYPIFYKKDEEKDPYYILMNCLMKDK